MMVLFWIAVGIYGLGVLFTSLAWLVLATASDSYRERVEAARVMASIPIWTLYWGHKLIIFIAESLQIIKEEKK